MTEAPDPETQRRRLRLRAWRRGTKEMDLILGGYADDRLAGMGPAELDAFEALLAEPDTDLYAWITATATAPERHAPLVDDIARGTGLR